MERRNTLKLIEDSVKAARSLEEAKQLVAAGIKEGGYFFIAESIVSQKIASLWQGKERARERALERLKENYGRKP